MRQQLLQVQVQVGDDGEVWEISLANPRIGKPVLEDDAPSRARPLLPRHCREMVGITHLT